MTLIHLQINKKQFFILALLLFFSLPLLRFVLNAPDYILWINCFMLVYTSVKAQECDQCKKMSYNPLKQKCSNCELGTKPLD